MKMDLCILSSKIDKTLNTIVYLQDYRNMQTKRNNYKSNFVFIQKFLKMFE